MLGGASEEIGLQGAVGTAPPKDLSGSSQAAFCKEVRWPLGVRHPWRAIRTPWGQGRMGYEE